MNNADYMWRIVFDDDPSYKIVARFLADNGEFEGNDFTSFRCPDGVFRSGMIVRHEVIDQARSLKNGRKRTVLFEVIRSKGSSGKPEFWPRLGPSRPNVLKEKAVVKKTVKRKVSSSAIMTGTEFAKKKTASAEPAPVQDQDQEKQGLHMFN